MNRPEVYIEGTDLTGKDSTAEIIRGKYGIANVQKLALHGDNPWDADRTKELPSGHPLFPAFLVRSIIWDIQHYDPSKEKDRLQISFTASRSAAWTQAAHTELKDLYTELLKYSPLFQNSFLLSASLEVKRERLKKRAKEGGVTSVIDNMIFTKPEFVERMDNTIKEIVSKEMGATVIDTSNYSIKQVGEIMVASINGDKVDIKREDRRVAQFDITPELRRFQSELLRYSRRVVDQHALPEEYFSKIENSFTKP